MKLEVSQDSITIILESGSFSWTRKSRVAWFVAEISWRYLTGLSKPAFVSHAEVMALPPFELLAKSSKATIMNQVLEEILFWKEYGIHRGNKTNGEWAWQEDLRLTCSDTGVLATWLGRTRYLELEEADLATARSLLEMGATQQALNLLENKKSTEANVLKAAAWIESDNLIEAQEILENLANSPEQQVQLARLAWKQRNWQDLTQSANAALLSPEPRVQAQAKLVLGAMFLELDELETAAKHFRHCEVLFAKLGHWWGLAATHLNLACVYYRRYLLSQKIIDLSTAQDWLFLVQIPQPNPNSSLCVQHQILSNLFSPAVRLEPVPEPTHLRDQIDLQRVQLQKLVAANDYEAAKIIRERLIAWHDLTLSAAQEATSLLENK